MRYNPDAESWYNLRMWVTETMVITLRHRPLPHVLKMGRDLQAGHGPDDLAALLERVVAELVDDVAVRLIEVDDELADLEARVAARRGNFSTVALNRYRRALGDNRYRTVMLRRWLHPQLSVLQKLGATVEPFDALSVGVPSPQPSSSARADAGRPATGSDGLAALSGNGGGAGAGGGGVRRNPTAKLVRSIGLTSQGFGASVERLSSLIGELDNTRMRSAQLQDELSMNSSYLATQFVALLTVVSGVFLPLQLALQLHTAGIIHLPGT